MNHKSYNKKYYQKNKDKLKTDAKTYELKHKKEIRTYRKTKSNWFKIFKESQGCAICGYDKCGDALVYHHVEPKEKTRVLDATRMYCGHKETYDELLKCVLLCSNCHMETHHLLRH